MVWILNLLAVILPLLLVIFGFLRVGVDKSTKGGTTRIRILNGFTMFFAVILLLIGAARFIFPMDSGRSSHSSEPKPPPIAVSKHTELFNSSMENALNVYYKMTEAFVNWDTTGINKQASDLIAALDNVKTEELKKDTTKDADKIYLTAVDLISNSKANATAILQKAPIGEKRKALNEMADNLQSLFIAVKYDKAKIYYQECPMAFDEGNPDGHWLSGSEAVRNPYLGTMHPKYGGGMVECGGPIALINFVPGDSTKLKKDD